MPCDGRWHPTSQRHIRTRYNTKLTNQPALAVWRDRHLYRYDIMRMDEIDRLIEYFDQQLVLWAGIAYEGDHLLRTHRADVRETRHEAANCLREAALHRRRPRRHDHLGSARQ